MAGINLDQIIAEAQRESLPLTLGGVTYDLPGELPLDVFTPFLDEELNLASVVADVFGAIDSADGSVQVIDLIVDTVVNNPALPLELVRAGGQALELLMGAEAYKAFWALRPTVPVVASLVRSLGSHYGVGLLDFSDSPDSSSSDGEPSTPTSDGSTASTPQLSGDAPATPAGS